MPVELRIYSEPCYLAVVRSAVDRLCRRIGLDEQGTSEVVLGLDEALSNVIRHAYGGRAGGRIDIELIPMSDGRRRGLRITVRDYGRTMAPESFRSLACGEGGGQGLRIIKACMDRVCYEPADGGGTRLTMTKCKARRKAEKAP